MAKLTSEEKMNEKYNRLLNAFNKDLFESIKKSVKKSKVKFKKAGFNNQETTEGMYDIYKEVTRDVASIGL